MGKKKQPFYRIVATDSRTRRDGKYIEKIGSYNPLTNPSEVIIDEEKAFYWLENGAIPSNTVKNLFSQKGIMLKWHFKKHGYDEAKAEEEYKKWELLQLEKQKRKEALEAQAKRDQETAPAEESEEKAKEEAAPAKESEPEIREEAAPAKEAEPEIKEEAVPEKEEEASTEKTEETTASQPEDQASKQNQEEISAEDQTTEAEKADELSDSKDK